MAVLNHNTGQSLIRLRHYLYKYVTTSPTFELLKASSQENSLWSIQAWKSFEWGRFDERWVMSDPLGMFVPLKSLNFCVLSDKAREDI
jgi:hypothetical protein